MLSSSDPLPESFLSVLLSETDLDATLQTINLTTDFVSQNTGSILDLADDLKSGDRIRLANDIPTRYTDGVCALAGNDDVADSSLDWGDSYGWFSG
jgi:hypothetical protein